MSVLKKSLAALGVCAVAASAISFEPVTAGATESAKKLYNFLAVNYGVKTITGVQTGDIADTYDALPDVISFEEHSGKKPVLVGLDFLFANGIKASDSWYKAYTQSAVDAAKDIWLSYDDSYDNKNNMNRKHLDYILDFMLNKMKKKYCTD